MRTTFIFAMGAFFLWMLWLLWARTGVNFANQQLMWQGGDPAAAGQWGDSFGGFNALVSALSTVAVVSTLIVQGRAIKEQRRDMHRQRFENSFFELLRLIQEARNEVRFSYSHRFMAAHIQPNNDEVVGAKVFRSAYREMAWGLRELRDSKKQFSEVTLSALYRTRVHARYESSLGTYYRLVYSLLDRIEADENLTKREKDDYGNLVRGQFTAPEAAIAGFNALTKESKDFRRLVVRFRLLKYTRPGLVRRALEQQFPAETFEGRDRKP